MENSTILSKRLQQAKQRDRAQQMILRQGDQGGIFDEPSLIQKRYWFLNQLEPNNPLHNRAFAWSLSGPFDQQVFSRTMSAIIERHEVLRTAIVTENNRPVASILPHDPIDIPIIDHSQRPELIKEEIERFSQIPIPLDQAPLLNTLIAKKSEQEHIALFVMHHVTFDALSEEIFKQEFSHLYASFLAGSPSSLPPLPIQMRDFSRWQKEHHGSEKLALSEQFWLNQLKDAVQLLSLPTDHPRPMAGGSRGGTDSFSFSSELVLQLEQFSRQNNVTPFMTMLSVFYLLLNRYTHQEDILVATPVSGRSQPETKQLIGFFANTIVLRGDLSDEPTFSEFLARIRTTCLQAFDHQDYPIDELFKSLKVEREADIPPLFQVLFNFEQINPTPPIPNGPSIESIELNLNQAQLDLAVEVQQNGQNFTCHFRYNRDLFDPATIGRMVTHFQILLDGCLKEPDTPISQLPILTEAEKQQILFEWNQTDMDYDRKMTIHRMFEQHVAQTPHAIAVKQQDQSMTYGELNKKANRLARYLTQRGVGPNKLVAVYLDRCVEMMVGLLAILKAGGAYVPIDPHLPDNRVEFMLKDSEATVAITQKSLQNQLPGFIKAICVDQLPAEVSSEKEENLETNVSSQNLLYVIYTSGSTGNPKGVMITHQNFYNYTIGRDQRGIFTRDDRLLQATSLSFDISAAQIFSPLVFGNRVTLAEPEGFKDIEGVLKTIAEEDITVLNCPPSVMKRCLASPKITDCTSIRYGVAGGEEVTPDLVHEFVQKLGVPLVNGYGPTETTIGLSAHWCDGIYQHHKIPIGRPSPNCKVYILDQHQNPVPVGVPGEIYVGGDYVGRGYWNLPELTDEKFIPNRYGDGKIYRTGDLARYLPDGNIEFLGRIDHQVKIRGFRIELGEIESTFLDHPDVRQAVVLAPNLNGSKQLVAYVVPNSAGSPISPKEISGFIGRKLPNYMLPSYIVTLGEFPLLVSGKINLKGLPQPTADHLISANTFVAPQTEIERELAGIWATILKIDQVGAQDNFFDLGGHSLLVAQIISRINARFDVDLPLKTFFDTPKLADQAELIELMAELF